MILFGVDVEEYVCLRWQAGGKAVTTVVTPLSGCLQARAWQATQTTEVLGSIRT